MSTQMFGNEDYPETVEEIIDDDMKYRKGVIAAVKRWKAKKLWGSKKNIERLEGLAELALELSPLYEIDCPTVLTDGIDLEAIVRDTKMKHSGSSSYNRATHTITMRGNLSIITFLHEFGHALGKGERSATKWSVNLFKRVFPAQYEKLDHKKHTLMRKRPDEDAINRVLSDG